MKSYRSRQIVEAAKITDVRQVDPKRNYPRVLVLDDGSKREVDAPWLAKVVPPGCEFGALIGGYLVRDVSGLEWWCRGPEFERAYGEIGQ